MDEDFFPVKAENLEVFEQLSSSEHDPELDALLEPLGDHNTEIGALSGQSSLLPQDLLEFAADDRVIFWNLIRSAQDTPTEFSDVLSLKSFEQEGLDELLTLDPAEYDSIFLPQNQTTSQPGSNASQQSALIRDIDIAAELLAELCKLDADENPEFIKPNVSEAESNFNTDFDIYPYCQPCQENPSSVPGLGASFTKSCMLPILSLTGSSMSSTPMQLPPTYDYEDLSHDTESVMLYNSIISSFAKETKNERSYLGHKETIFGISFSPCGQYVATASQDSTIRVWRSTVNKCLSTLSSHDPKYECLRVAWASPVWVQKFQHLWTNRDNAVGSSLILATAGADGVVKIWLSMDDANNWKSICTVKHFSPETIRAEKTDEDGDKEQNEEDKPQIYSIQFIDGWNPSHPSSNFYNPHCILTTSDDFIHLWEPQSFESNNEKTTAGPLVMSRIMSIRFTHLVMGFGGVFVLFSGDDMKESPNTFHYPTVDIDQALLSSSPAATPQAAYGGPRNPDNLVYVFDASYCHANGLVGVALSDGSLRLVNGRGSCVFVLQLPECKARLTSFAWDLSGRRIASCVGTGQIILWSILCDPNGRTEASCSAILEGGHALGRPVYGVRYIGSGRQDMILSWGVDGTLCLWAADGSPLKTLVSKSGYPIFAADISDFVSASGKIYIGVGGGNDGGFIGTPFYVYDVMCSTLL